MLDKQERALILQATGGKRKFRLTLSAISRFKQRTGLDLQDAMTMKEAVKDPAVITALLWAGIVREAGEDLTEEQVGDWFDLGQVLTLAGQIETYINFLFPDDPKGEREGPPKGRG